MKRGSFVRLCVLVAVVVTFLPVPSHAASVFVVDSAADESDGDTGDGLCDTGTGACTLRAAIQQANASAGADSVEFDLPGSPPYSIQPTTTLPFITSSLSVDATTQPGYAGSPIVELSGASMSSGLRMGFLVFGGTNLLRGFIINNWNTAIYLEEGSTVIEGSYIGLDPTGAEAEANDSNGIDVRSPGNTVGGLTEAARNVISGNNGPGISIHGGDGGEGTTIIGNYIGTNAAGDAAVPNAGSGVSAGGPGTLIGGSTPGSRNVISGNASRGIGLGATTGAPSVIQGNYIGLDASGQTAVGNEAIGIDLDQASGTIIGGTSPGEGNVISGNGSVGITTAAVPAASSTVIQGNLIGTDASGSSDVGNGQVGVQLIDGTNNLVGGTELGTGNTIAYNGTYGVVLHHGTGNAILGNSIHSHGSQGIVTVGSEARPVLSRASSTGGTTSVEGSLDMAPETTFRLEFFSNPPCSPPASTEGETFLGFASVSTDSAGHADFNTEIPPVEIGDGLTATATGDGLNTTGFSLCRTVEPGEPPTGMQAIGSGDGHMCAIDVDGALFCWGDNTLGDLGDGTTQQRNRPVSVVGLSSGVEVVRGGEAHTCASLTSGGVKCWGENNDGQLGIGFATTHRTTPQDVVGISSALSVGAEGDHACALLQSGNAKCWGKSNDGQLGKGFPLGGPEYSPVDVQLSEPAQSIEAGWNHTCAVTQTGGAKCWGANGAGQVGDGTTNSPRATPQDVSGLQSGVVQIAPGMGHTCALTTTGVKCWGSRAQGELGDGQTSSFPPQTTPVNVLGLLPGIQSIGSGAHHSCAITADGGLKCWGDNDYGQLGNNSTSDQSTPVQVTGLTSGVVQVAAGRRHTCALLDDGTVMCWGENQFGQLGRGPGPGSLVPVEVEFGVELTAEDPTDLEQFESDATTTIPVGGSTEDSTVVLSGTVSVSGGTSDDVRLEVEVKPVGMDFDETGLAQSPGVSSGEAAQVVIGGLTEGTSYHWRARTTDGSGPASEWVSFGGNDESESDFSVETVPQPPEDPTDLAQLEADGTTAIPAGGTTDGTTVKLRGTVSSSNPGPEQLRLEIEFKQLGTPFDGAGLLQSANVNRGQAATITVSNLSRATSYHWRARTVGEGGLTSAWVSYGGNLETAPDLVVEAPLVFSSNRHGANNAKQQEIYLMNPDGSNPVRLTTNNAIDTDPNLSPDGTRIAFASDRDGDYEIYTMNLDGTNLSQVTVNTAADQTPAWSPNGQKLAFTTNRAANDNNDIWSMNATGSNAVRLTTGIATDAYPAWSPDGSRIAFMSARDGDAELFTMAPDGSNQVPITSNKKIDDSFPAWSPDGSSIAFESNRDSKNDSHIYLLDLSSSVVTSLTTKQRDDTAPAFSRSGARIAFQGLDADNDWEIYLMTSSGGVLTKLTNNNRADVGVGW